MYDKRYFVILFQLLLVVIFSLGLFFVVENRGIGFQKPSNKISAQSSYVLGESIPSPTKLVKKESFPSLNVCFKEDCYYLHPEVVESFYKNSDLDNDKVLNYLNEYIFPFFEELSGGKKVFQNKNGNFYAWKEDEVIDTSKLYDDVVELLDFVGLNSSEITCELNKKEVPGTDGKYSNRYIEIDNSRQKLFAWDNGEVTKEVELSGAKYGWQVYGVFPIIDKGLQPMAPSGNYMPYWMAFHYDPRQDSWFGLHALVWWYDDNGNVVNENTDYIGVRRSKGCIRMLEEDAKYLYERYEKGDNVLIHE
jgi:hypothetical protein